MPITREQAKQLFRDIQSQGGISRDQARDLFREIQQAGTGQQPVPIEQLVAQQQLIERQQTREQVPALQRFLTGAQEEVEEIGTIAGRFIFGEGGPIERLGRPRLIDAELKLTPEEERAEQARTSVEELIASGVIPERGVLRQQPTISGVETPTIGERVGAVGQLGAELTGLPELFRISRDPQRLIERPISAVSAIPIVGGLIGTARRAPAFGKSLLQRFTTKSVAAQEVVQAAETLALPFRAPVARIEAPRALGVIEVPPGGFAAERLPVPIRDVPGIPSNVRPIPVRVPEGRTVFTPRELARKPSTPFEIIVLEETKPGKIIELLIPRKRVRTSVQVAERRALDAQRVIEKRLDAATPKLITKNQIVREQMKIAESIAAEQQRVLEQFLRARPKGEKTKIPISRPTESELAFRRAEGARKVFKPGEQPKAIPGTIETIYRDVAREKNIRSDKMFGRLEEYNKMGLTVEEAMQQPDILDVFSNHVPFKENFTPNVPYSRSLKNKFLDFITHQTRRVERMGFNGQAIAQRSSIAIDRARQLQDRWTQQFRSIMKGLNRKERDNLIFVRRGQAQPISDKVVAANELLEGFTDGVMQVAVKGNIPVGNVRNYIPQYIDEGRLLNPKLRENAKKIMVETRFATDPQQAERILKDLDQFYSVSDTKGLRQEFGNIFQDERIVSTFGSFDFSRKLTDPKLVDILTQAGIMERDIINIFENIYIPRAARRIEVAKQFGVNDEVFEALARGIRPELGDEKYVREFYKKVVLGRNNVDPIINNLVSITNTVGGILALGGSAPAQLGSLGAIIGVGGVRNTIVGLAKSLRSPKLALAEASEVAAIMRGYSREILDVFSSSQMSKSGKILASTQKVLEAELTLGGTKLLDNGLRVLAVSTGKRFIPRSFEFLKSGGKEIRGIKTRQAMFAEMQKYVPNLKEALKRGALTEDEFSLALKKFSDRLVGRPSAENLPQFAGTPAGRAWTSLSRTVLQMGNIYFQSVFKPAAQAILSGGKRGTMIPFIRTLGLGQAMGFGIGELRAWMFNRDRSEMGIPAMILDNYSQIALLGFIGDVFNRLFIRRGELDIPTERNVFEQIGETITPTGAQILSRTISATVRGERKRLPRTLELLTRPFAEEE